MVTPLDLVLSRLRRVTRAGDGFTAHCPAHDDRRPSLSLAEGRNGRVLVHCFAGCTVEEICRALHLRVADLFPRRRRAS